MNPLFCIAVAVTMQAAKDQPLVAVHPLEVTGVTGSAVEEVSDDFFIELSRQPIDLVSKYEVEQALASKRCTGGFVPCLGKLAAATGAKLALWTSLHIDAESYRVQAKVVDPNGEPVREGVDLTFPKDLTQPRSPQVRAAFKAVFTELSMNAPKPVPPPVVTKPATEPPPVVAKPIEPTPAKGSALRPLGVVAGGLALATGATAVGFGVWNAVTAAGVRDRAMLGHIQPGEDEDRVRAINRNTAIAAGLGVGAGVLAALSAVLLLNSGGDEAVAISAGPGGAHVVFSGRLP